MAMGSPHCCNLPDARQISVGPGWRILWRSVVLVGAVQVRMTVFPFLRARRSLTGRASSSEGGSGSPGLPQAPSTASETKISAKLIFATVIPGE